MFIISFAQRALQVTEVRDNEGAAFPLPGKPAGEALLSCERQRTVNVDDEPTTRLVPLPFP